MATSYSIRAALAPDIARCAALYERVGRDVFTWRLIDSFQASDFFTFAAEEEVTIAEEGGGLLGFLSFYRPQSFVHGLYVEQHARGRRIGARLLELVASDAEAALTLKCDTANEAALAFYRKLGFKAVEQGSEDGVPWVLLRAPSQLGRAGARLHKRT